MSSFRPGGLDLTQRLLDLAGAAPGSALLDLGCGAGESLAFLQTRYICTGLEPDLHRRRAAQAANPTIPVVDGRAEQLPFPDHSFQLVLAECVLSLTQPLSAALAEIRRVLVPGGLLLLSDVYARKQPKLVNHGMLGQLLSLPQWEEALTQEGFRIRSQEETNRSLTQMLCQLILDLGPAEAYAQLGLDGCGLRQAGAGYILMIGESL